SQQKTQSASKRPFGVGLLVVGVDDKGPHVYETCPSGNCFEYYAMAIGGRSTSARTYLEKNFSDFEGADEATLVKHALEAMNKTTASDQTLSVKNTAVAVISLEKPFRELNDAELQVFLDKLEAKAAEADEPEETTAVAPAEETPAEAMDTSG
ncbi:unnamed protein product, partial [Polarella glacialis]